MWLPSSVLAEVDQIAWVRYYSRDDCAAWNKHRRDGELRLLTGWGWIAKNGQTQRQGFKTMTVAYRDAYYALVLKEAAPSVRRMRVIRGRAA